MIHCISLKLPRRTDSSVGRIAGTLEISRPNISEAKQTAAIVKTSFCEEQNCIVIFQIKLMGTRKTALNAVKGETR